MPACTRFGNRGLGEDGGDLGSVSNEEIFVFLGDAPGHIGGAEALRRIAGRESGDELARSGAAIRLHEESLRVGTRFGESRATRMQQVVF
jgi:hypothetical protein